MHKITREKMLDILIKNKRESPFERHILVIEHKKVNSQVGIVNAEIVKDTKEVVFGGGMICSPLESDEFTWKDLKKGESHYGGYWIDTKPDTIGSMIKEGLTKSIKEGKVPFLR